MADFGYIDWSEIDFSKIENYADVPNIIRDAVKPCPFCGSKRFSMTPPHMFEQSMKEFGFASVVFACRSCDCTMYDTCRTETDYKSRLITVLKKWNARPKKGGNKNGDSDVSRKIQTPLMG